MKVWEAIQMLEAMDQNKEVTVTMGQPKKAKLDQYLDANAYLPGQATPMWVIGKEFWPTRNEITCKMH